MPRKGPSRSGISPFALQAAIDAVDVVGSWEWDMLNDRVRADPLVALLFGVNPADAAEGVSFEEFKAGIYPEDRSRIERLICDVAKAGGFYIAEYRVQSADGVTRWVLARGRFTSGTDGLPGFGQGIVVDTTETRGAEEAYVTRLSTSLSPLQRAAEQVLTLHELTATLEDPVLHRMAEMMLFRLAQRLAGEERAQRLQKMN